MNKTHSNIIDDRSAKIAIINNTARRGSTGKLAYNQFVNLKKAGFKVRLFYGRARESDIHDEDIICLDTRIEVAFHVVMARLTGLHGYYSNLATLKLIYRLDKFRPDVVHLYNLHGYYLNIYMLLNYLKRNDIPTVYFMVDEFPYLGRNCYLFDEEVLSPDLIKNTYDIHQYPKSLFLSWNKKYYYDKMRAYDRKRIRFIAPRWGITRAIQSGIIGENKCSIADSYVDVDQIFYPRIHYEYIDYNKEWLNKIIVLSVAPFSDKRKGGEYFLEIARKYVDDPRFMFVYVGMDVKNVDLPRNCHVVGYVSNQEELAEYFSAADLFICTSLADAMPNTCLDALSCGTPVLGFLNSGVPDVAIEPFGVFVENKSIDDMCKVISTTKKKNQKTIEGCRQYALNRYAPKIYYERMLDIYKLVLEE